MKFLILVIVLFLNVSVYASSRTGNGGNVRVCGPNIGSDFFANYWQAYNGRAEVKVFDYAEYVSMESNLSYDQIVLRVIERLAEYDPSRAAKYLIRFESFFEDVTYVNYLEQKYAQLEDAFRPPRNHGLEKGCTLILAAVQHYSTELGKSTFEVDYLFHRLSAMNKAGLILHEIIYEEFIQKSDADHSEDVRFYNWFISSELFKDNITQAGYDKVLRSLGL